MQVKIFGAGSIGNHLAQASRRMGWGVIVVDKDPQALARMKNDIYPTRYGSWDNEIKLCVAGQEPKGSFDIIMIGTPPDVHMPLAIAALPENPRLLHIEKPLATPDLEWEKRFSEELAKHPETFVTVGYDYSLGEATQALVGMLREKKFGEILSLDVEVREHWSGIFGAHPWLSGPEDTYLGYWIRGGGAGGEHSHALHLWLYLSRQAFLGKAKEVKSMLDFKKTGKAEYDILAAFLLQTESGAVGRVIQDVVTLPVKVWARVQGSTGFAEWHLKGSPQGDLLRYQMAGGEIIEKVFPKKRPDDFYREVMHYKDLLEGKTAFAESPLAYDRGLEVMHILHDAYFKNN